MLRKDENISRIFTAVSLVAALFVATEGLFQAFGRSICAAEGCKLVAKYARYGDLTILLFGFLLFSGFALLSIVARRGQNRLLDSAINVILVAALASEGFFTGYQAFRLHAPCVFCLIVFGFVVVLALIRLFQGEMTMIAGFASLVAVFSLFFLVLPVGSTVSIPNESQLVLFYGKDCKYCAEVRAIMDEKKVRYDHVPVNDYSGMLENMGIEHVPTLYVNNGQEKIFLTGREAILGYLNCSDQKTAKSLSQKAPGKRKSQPNPTAAFNPFELTAPDGKSQSFKLVLPPAEEGVCKSDEKCK